MRPTNLVLALSALVTLAAVTAAQGLWPGMVNAARLTNGRGVGIRNTCERLQVLYGERGAVQVHNTEPGLRVALSFPAEGAVQLAA